MKIFAIICTRDRNLGSITKGLITTLSSYGVEIKLLASQNSIFEAYHRGLQVCGAEDKDIIIYCHDDLQIQSSHQAFVASLSKCVEEETGIVGPAGTTHLGKDAVWWDQERWRQGQHRGQVKHRAADNSAEIVTTSYGDFGQVVALDGLFLAARKEVWKSIGLEKPPYFEGDWDFYDIHYTTTAHKLGYKNYAVPLSMLHHSSGELVGRDSWHKNRKAFIANTELPIRI